MVGLRRPSAAVHRVHSPWQNEKTSPAESLVARSIRGHRPRPAAAAASTISREVARHGGRAQYRANEADQQAWESALRPKPCLLATHTPLREIVASKLMQDWSPEQVSGWLKWQFPKDESLRVSHETIYRSLFLQARGALKKELIQHLRSQRRIRRSRHSSVHGHSQGKIVDAISIRERPAEVEDRAIPGHWEGDLLRGARNSHVATLVERHSRFCMLVKVPGKDTTTVVAALSRHVRNSAGDVAALADLGPRVGDGPAQKLHHGYGRTGLLLRSPKPLAARFERKHERAAAAIPAEEGGSVLLLTVGPGRDRSAPQSHGHEKHWDFETPADKLQASVASTP